MDKIQIVIGIIGSLLAFLGLHKVLINKLKKEVSEALEKGIATGKKIKLYRSENSAGGKKLTADEIQDLLPDVVDTVVEIVDVIETVQELVSKKKKK